MGCVRDLGDLERSGRSIRLFIFQSLMSNIILKNFDQNSCCKCSCYQMTAILQEFSEFCSGNAAVNFLIRILVRSRFVISMSADSMYF